MWQCGTHTDTEPAILWSDLSDFHRMGNFIGHTKIHRCYEYEQNAWLLIAISFWFYWNNRNGTQQSSQEKKKVNDDQSRGDKLPGKPLQVDVDVIWFDFLQSRLVFPAKQIRHDDYGRAIHGPMTGAQIGFNMRSRVTCTASRWIFNLLTCVWPHLFHFVFLLLFGIRSMYTCSGGSMIYACDGDLIKAMQWMRFRVRKIFAKF